MNKIETYLSRKPSFLWKIKKNDLFENPICKRKVLNSLLRRWDTLDRFPPFLDGFFKNPSFKIAMSRWVGVRRAGVGRRPRLTFWLTFFQSCMLPLFFSGLLSYLVGMERRTISCFPCKRDNSHFLHYLKNLSIMPLGIFLVLRREIIILWLPVCFCILKREVNSFLLR